MKGVIVEKPGASPQVVDNLETPEPADGQVLVKSIYTAINPVDAYMANTGLLVVDWPLVIGCDAAGVVVKAGSKAVGPLGPLKVGDEVCGCARLGHKGYSTCEEYFLMDAALAVPKPKNISLAQAATVGVGFETACCGIFNGLGLEVPDVSNLPSPSEHWALVLGGASSVGKYASQILRVLGFKVVVSCSEKSAEVVKPLADAWINYKKPEEEQLSEILSITGGNLTRVFDAVAMYVDFAKKLFQRIEKSPKYFTTTNDWQPMAEADLNGGKPYAISLGPIGRPDAEKLNKDIQSFIPFLVNIVEAGKVVPSDYDIIGKPGLESVLEAYEHQQKGLSGNRKVVAQVQEM